MLPSCYISYVNNQSAWHSRKAHKKNPAFQDHGRNQFSRPPLGWAVWVSTCVQHDPPVSVISWVSKKQQTGAIFLNVAKAFNSVWIKGHFFKLTIVEFLSYLVKLIISYLYSCTFMMSFHTASWGQEVTQGESSLLCSSEYMSTFPHYIELAQYPDIWTYMSELKIWIWDWMIAINIGKSAAVLFKTRCIPTPQVSGRQDSVWQKCKISRGHHG